jgi:hypothetical protein
MASNYPGSLDSFSTTHADDVGEIIHASTVNDLADGVNKIEAELGTDPSDTYTDVATRLDAIDASIPTTFFGPRFPDMVGISPLDTSISIGTRTANTILLLRVVIPKTGHLRDITVWVDTGGGNSMLGVYDCGGTTAGSATRLATSGSVSSASANTYLTYDPNLSVTRGQHLLLAHSNDSGTASFGKLTVVTAAMYQLPANFLTPDAGNLLPKGWAAVSGVFTLPATIAEATLVSTTIFPVIFARIS